MGRNEIKLRRQMLTPGDIGRYRDYPALMRRHERAQKVKRNVRIFTYSILITVVVVLMLIAIAYVIIRWEKKRELKQKENIHTSWVRKPPAHSSRRHCLSV